LYNINLAAFGEKLKLDKMTFCIVL